MNNSNSRQPVIAGVQITTDAAGRFNLNALHKASGAEKKNGPSYWLALEGTQALIAELEQTLSDTGISVSPINVIKGGLNQGTFAHELLAIEYAGWISPSYRLQVNQTFLDFRTGKLVAIGPALPDFNDPIAAAEAWIEAKKAERFAIGYVDRQARYISKLESQLAEGITPVQFCKQLNGINTRLINAFLEGHNWLYDDRPDSKHPRWRVRAYARDKYLTERSGKYEHESGDMRDTFTPHLTRKGAAWIYRQYQNGRLPMKKSWDGKFTHDMDLQGVINASA